MHLFQNKKKDVKQFLEEMKANKTNRSSNQKSISFAEKKPSRQISQQSNMNDSNQSFMKGMTQEPSNKYSNGNSQNQFRSPPSTMNPSYQQSYRFPQYPQQLSNRGYQRDLRFNSTFHTQEQTMQNSNRTYNSNQIYNQSTVPLQNRYSRNFSQDSNTTNYQPYQYYQNNDFQRSVSMNQPYMKPQTMTTHNNLYRSPSTSFQQRPLQNLQNPNFQRHNSQSQFYQNRNEPQNSNYKFFSSQVSATMQEIREAQQGLSTQKDSPVKLTQFNSKPKKIQQIQIISDQNNFKRSIFQTLYDEEPQKMVSNSHQKNTNQNRLYPEIKNKFISQNDNTLKKNNQIRNEKKMEQFKKDQKNEEAEYDFKIQIQDSNPQFQKEDQHQQPKLKISLNQKRIICQKFPQIDKLKVRMNDILNQVSIILQNVTRSNNSIDYDLKNPAGKYYHYLNKQNSSKNFYFSSIRSPIIQQEDYQSSNFTHEKGNNSYEKTYKKRIGSQKNKLKSDKERILNFQETMKKKKYVFEEKQIEI